MPVVEPYGTNYVFTTSASSASMGPICTTYTTQPGNITYTAYAKEPGPYSWQEPARPARRATNRELLAAAVDEVCALARK